jgi:hypothetical protein
MTQNKIYITITLILFCTLTVFAGNRLAIINDPDGFTNIRSGQGNEFPIVSTINKDEFFYCDLTNSEWIKVIALKWQNGNQVEGYIHKSRVQLVENLDFQRQKELIKQILDKQRILANNFQKAWKSKDSIAYRTTVRELELCSEIKYSPILEILPKYFCETKDTMILDLFYSTIWADKGSANEMPSFAISECFICNSDLVIKQLQLIVNKEQKDLVYDNIEWGLMNKFEVEEDGQSDNLEFNQLKSKLEKERIKARP